LLIRPPVPKELRCGHLSVQVPLNLGYLAGVLANMGFEVDIWDYTVIPYNSQQLLQYIQLRQPIFVGFTAQTSSIGFVGFMAAKIKRFYPGLPIIVGGVHATALPVETLEELPGVDIIVVGEGELTIQQLAEALLLKKDLSAVAGIALRQEDGKIQLNPRQPLLKSLDYLDYRVHRFFNHRHYRHNHVSRGFSRRYLRIAELITARGCPHNCVFCAGHLSFGNSVRFRSLSHLAYEIDYLKKDLRIQHISIEDDTLSLNPKLVDELGAYLKGKNISWNCNARVDEVTPALIYRMVRNNCQKISFGIESGSERILRLAKKRINLSQIKEAFLSCRRAGLRYLEANFMLGSHPDEMPDDIFQTQRLIFELKPDFVTVTVMCPFPGTENFLALDSQGVLKKNWMRYNLVSRNLPYCRLNHLTAQELLFYRDKIMRSYYTSLRYLWQRFTQLRQLNELGYLVRLARSLQRAYRRERCFLGISDNYLLQVKPIFKL